VGASNKISSAYTIIYRFDPECGFCLLSSAL